ncbi:MAG: tRNA-specific adenosine deaminase [candidate division Zixibacteria bacterium RBG_16_53_22]|nr:MAG: tRNA-specific adenosine deaminase [candidate division Zixibacteria bacterium RBG_16_53_22]
METIDFNERFMMQALNEAHKAYQADEVPIGCVIVHEGMIIGRGYNRTEGLQDPTAHAEMLAITAATEYLGSWRLVGCTAYCTIEPCAMCAGALVLARVERLVFGAPDPKFGACGSIFNICQNPQLNHRIAVSTGILTGDCVALMQEFFGKKRRNG